MEYLTQDEIAMIFARWLARRVPRIQEPTKFFCALCTEPGFGRYLHVCNDMSHHKNIKPICEFDANSPDDRPNLEQIKRSVEEAWNFLSEIRRNDYEPELKEAQENT
jgi:hypothetical protein